MKRVKLELLAVQLQILDFQLAETTSMPSMCILLSGCSAWMPIPSVSIPISGSPLIGWKGDPRIVLSGLVLDIALVFRAWS